MTTVDKVEGIRVWIEVADKCLGEAIRKEMVTEFATHNDMSLIEEGFKQKENLPSLSQEERSIWAAECFTLFIPWSLSANPEWWTTLYRELGNLNGSTQ